MGSEWPKIKVGDLADSISDTHCFGKDHLVFLNTSDVAFGKVLHHTYTAIHNWPGQAKKSIQKDDILFSEIRPANGRWAYIDFEAEDYVVSTKLMVIRSKINRIHPRFLYHFLTSSKTTSWLQHLAESRSGTFPQITFDQVADLELVLPPIAIQLKISSFLDTLNDKIELNRKMNETLEAMTRSLFKSWFVDFDHVHSKVAGRDPSLPKHIADLFPDSFEDSELGEIPKGWKVKQLGELLELAYGKALKSDNRQHGIVPVYGSNGQVGWHDEKLVAGPGIVVGRKGNPGIITWSPTDFFPIDTTFYVIPKDSCRDLHFLFYALQMHNLASIGADSAVPGLNRNLAYMSKQLVPPTRALEEFGQLVRVNFERIHQSNEESNTLAALRDALLPKLISGELRIKDAERFIERSI